MSIYESWKKIYALIVGVKEAANIHAQFSISHNKNPYGADKFLQLNYTQILNEVNSFKIGFENQLSEDVRDCLERFAANPGNDIRGNALGDELLGRAIIVKIAAFAAEMNFLLSDSQIAIRSRCEVAFIHLQRLIMVNDQIRSDWIKAFENGETECEQLGSVHMLSHMIWAFKIDSKGQRTDLVLPESNNMLNQGINVNLVLTEWKIEAGNALVAFERAQKQGQLYAQGALGGMELSNFRYAIVLSKKQITPPLDTRVGHIIWRNINIAVDPDTPSVAAKKI